MRLLSLRGAAQVAKQRLHDHELHIGSEFASSTTDHHSEAASSRPSTRPSVKLAASSKAAASSSGSRPPPFADCLSFDTVYSSKLHREGRNLRNPKTEEEKDTRRAYETQRARLKTMGIHMDADEPVWQDAVGEVVPLRVGGLPFHCELPCNDFQFIRTASRNSWTLVGL